MTIKGTMLRKRNAVKEIVRKKVMILKRTFIWFNAESFKPVISKTFRHMLICRPYFSVAVGYNKSNMLEYIKS